MGAPEEKLVQAAAADDDEARVGRKNKTSSRFVAWRICTAAAKDEAAPFNAMDVTIKLLFHHPPLYNNAS